MSDLREKILGLNPAIPPQAVDRALGFLNNPKVTNKKNMVIVDFSLSDAKERFHFINLETGEADHYKVAHGKNSDQNKDNTPDHFSNVPGSYQSSLGAMVINEEVNSDHYKVVHLMTGLEKGLNDHVRERAILWHSAAYVDDGTKAPSGDTLGCFGMAVATAIKLNKLVTGCLLYAWHPSLEGVVTGPAVGETKDRLLRLGAKGDDVKGLQVKLSLLGFDPGPADGFFGAKTEFAVKAFQVSKGLLADGVLGPQTAAAMGDKIEVPVAVRPLPTYKTLAQIDAAFEKGTAAWCQAAYLISENDPGMDKRVLAAAKQLLAGKANMYLELERLRGIPWAMVGMIHAMECDNNPRGVLHNGELIVGTSRKTTLVPKGRGPFRTWIEAALDAVDSEALWQVPNWSVGYMLKQCEKFNGTGYLKYHHNENSPYLWACTTINDGTGKYVSDGVWSETADANTQVGCAAILKKLEDMGEATVLYA